MMRRGWIGSAAAFVTGAAVLYGVQVAGVALPFAARSPAPPRYEWTTFRFGFGSSTEPLDALLRQGWEVRETETVRDPGDGLKLVFLRRRVG